MINTYNKALKHLKREDIVQTTSELIDIPSPVGGEKAIGDYLAERFKKAGLKVITQKVEEDRHNVIGILEGAGGGSSLMYCGHMDTMWSGDEEGIKELGPGYWPHSYSDDEWIYGLGARNMKSGLASAIVSVEAIAKAKIALKGDLIMACVVGETCRTQVGRYQGSLYRGTGLGGRSLVNRITADFAVCPEGTSSQISIAAGGYVYFEITTKGNPGSTYARGSIGLQMKPAKDAIEKMTHIIEAIKNWEPAYRAKHKYKGSEATNVNIISVEGGHPWRPSKIASFCRLYLEVDAMPGQHPQDVIGEVNTLLDDCRSKDPELDIELNVIQITYGSEISEEEHIVTALSKAHHHIYKSDPYITWHGWLADTTALTRAGIPAVCYGPAGRVKSGGAGYFPKEGEHAYIDDLLDSARVFVKLSLDICSKDRAHILEKRIGRTGTVVF